MKPKNLKSNWRWRVVPTILCLGIILMPAVSLAQTLIEYNLWLQIMTLKSETLTVYDESSQAEANIICGREYIGGTSGTLSQDGYINLTDELYLGDESGSSGTYNLSGGTLAAGIEYIGFNGTGIFIQSGGSNSSANITGGLSLFFSSDTNLYLGYNSGSRGTYELQGGSLSAKHEYIGYLGTGTFTQNGGTHTVDHLFIGVGVLSNGTYNLEGGTLSAGTIQVNPTGSFNVTGGTHTVSGDVANAGTIKTTNAEVVWDGEVFVVQGGSFISDPSTNEFKQDFICYGTLSAAEGDVLSFSQDLTLEGEAELAESTIKFVDGLDDNEHSLTLPAETLTVATLSIAEGEVLILENDGTLYATVLEGLEIDYEQGIIENIALAEGVSDVTLIYDINENPDLAGQTFSLVGGEGELIPTPLPASVLLLGSGLLGLGLLGRRRRQS
jgi:hypothetical protein